jgi:hypothetical protein
LGSRGVRPFFYSKKKKDRTGWRWENIFFVPEKEAKMAGCSHFSSDTSQKHIEMKKNTGEPPEHTLSFSPMQSFR